MFLKKFVPFFIKDLRNQYLNRPVINYFNSNYNKKALLSYTVTPFRTVNIQKSHTNNFEAISWAKILDELGYIVDIVQFENNKYSLDLSKYSLICGFGDVFKDYFENYSEKNIKTIYYGAGMHVCYQNTNTLKRVKDVFYKKGKWILGSTRFVEKTWSHQTSLVDGIIALGNNVCADSYKSYFDGIVLDVPAPFFKTLDIDDIINNRGIESKKHFLWFGSSGLIHKGLDLVLDYFSQNNDIVLHVCGPIENEKEFTECYKEELYSLDNVVVHGFVDIESEQFKIILSSCSFVIYPSCSEGGSPSLLTVVGNGALIPIISKETTVSTKYEIPICTLDYNGISKSMEKAKSLDFDEIAFLQRKNYEYVIKNHTQNIYYNKLKFSISSILKEKSEVQDM